MDATADDLDDRRTAYTVGKEFADGYYSDGSNGNKGLLMERFCDRKSKYLFLPYGRETEFQARGTAEIAKFAIRMKYRECAVAVVSVDAIKVRRPNLFAVLAVCKLTRLGNGVAHKFVQSTVLRYVPSSSSSSSSTENRFVIVGTVFKFADQTAADDGLEPECETPAMSLLPTGTVEPSETEPLSSCAPEQSLSSNNDFDNYRSTSADPPKPPAFVDGGVIIDAEPDGKPQTAKAKKRAQRNAAMLVRTAVNGTSSADDDDGSETKRKPAAVKSATDAAETRHCRPSKTEIESPVFVDDSVVNADVPRKTETKRAKHNNNNNNNKEPTVVNEEPATAASGGPETEAATGKTRLGTTNAAVTTGGGSRKTETKPPAKNPTKNPAKNPAKNPVKTPATAAGTAGSGDNPDVLKNRGGLLYVGGVPRSVKCDDLRKAFGRFDDIVRLNICTKKKKGRRRPNYCSVVEFSDPGTAVKVAKLGTVLLDNGDRVLVQQLEGKQIGRPKVVK